MTFDFHDVAGEHLLRTPSRWRLRNGLIDGLIDCLTGTDHYPQEDVMRGRTDLHRGPHRRVDTPRDRVSANVGVSVSASVGSGAWSM